MKYIFLSLLFLFNFFVGNSQSSNFDIELEPVNISSLGGIQSYSFAQHEGKWLIVGGRLDGLHRRQPWAAFDVAGHNNQLIVIDPISQEKWTANLTDLNANIQEHLSSTNMEFFQEGDYLYTLGGYGYSDIQDDHITFDKLTALDVPAVMDAIINGENISSHIRQITAPQFAVTGGRLDKIYDTYYLVGGQKFIGRYNPMGPNMGPGFIQEYTNQIRKFNLADDGVNITISFLPSMTDEANLHRRDYNVVPQIMPNGEEGLTAFSGVFQYNVELPFLNCVNIDSAGYVVNDAFSQYYNHYHCANIPLYSATDNEMHTLFFGGIAQFYDDSGVLVQDDDVPFVKTIARVTRDENGNMTEYKLPIEMPAYLGAGSEFIPNKNLPTYSNGVVKLDNLNSDTMLLGYIYGGISSTQKNIFFTNDGSQSSASSQVYKVIFIKNATSNTHEINHASASTLDLNIFPNPSNGDLYLLYNLEKSTGVTITLHNMDGEIIFKEKIPKAIGKQEFYKKLDGLSVGNFYLLTVETLFEKETRRVIVVE